MYNESNGSGGAGKEGVEKKVMEVGAISDGFSPVEFFACRSQPQFDPYSQMFSRDRLVNYLKRAKGAGYEVIFTNETTPLAGPMKRIPLTKEDESYFRQQVGL